MKRGRGQRAGLSRTLVLAEGAKLVSEEGYAALSMRRLADRLGVAPTALYSHVTDRVDLVDGLLDWLLARVTVPSDGPPRVRLGELMRRVRLEILSYPELTPLFFSRRTIGPEALRIGGAATELLITAGVDPAIALSAMKALMVFTIGAATVELPPTINTPANDAQEPQLDSDRTFETGLTLFMHGISRGAVAPSGSEPGVERRAG